MVASEGTEECFVVAADGDDAAVLVDSAGLPAAVELFYGSDEGNERLRPR